MHGYALVLFYAFLVLSVISASIKGGPPERWGASIIMLMLAFELGGRAFVPDRLHSVDPLAVVIDGFGTVSFGILALYARRAWPIWATALQILSATSHFAQGVDPAAHPGIYIVMKSGPTFFVLLVLLAGTVAHQRRLQRDGNDPAWMKW